MIVPWRYWFDGSSIVVFLLLIFHSSIVYKCMIDGYLKNEKDLTKKLNEEKEINNQVIPLGPVYSLRLHFTINEENKNWQNNDIEEILYNVAPADVLLLIFKNNIIWNEIEILKKLYTTKRWKKIMPILPFQNYYSEKSCYLSDRYLSFLEPNMDSFPLLMIRLRDASVFFSENFLISSIYNNSIPIKSHVILCFLAEEDPAQVRLSSGQTLQDEVYLDPHKSNIPEIAMRLSHSLSKEINLVFFIFPCHENRVQMWDESHLNVLGNFTVWWVCAASETLVEVNAAAQFLTVFSGE